MKGWEVNIEITNLSLPQTKGRKKVYAFKLEKDQDTRQKTTKQKDRRKRTKDHD